jgi:hypothetical protein
VTPEVAGPDVVVPLRRGLGRLGNAPPPGPALSGGGGDGTYDDMREKVAKLEVITEALQKGFERVEDQGRSIGEALARIEIKLDTKAGNTEMVTALG